MEKFDARMPGIIKNKYRITKNWFKTPLELNENSLLQIGATYFNEYTHITPHSHTNFYELTFIKDGTGSIIINNTPLKVKKDDICLTMPYDKHEIVSSKDNLLEIFNLAFIVSNTDLVSQLNQICHSFHAPDKRIFSDNNIAYLIGLMLNEVHGNEPNQRHMLSSLLDSIIIYLMRNFSPKSDKKSLGNITEHEILCYQIMSYIDTNILNIKNLNELAELTNYSYPYLSLVFKNVTKMTLKSYFMNAKFEKAHQLLTKEQLSVNKVSQMLNYSSANAFTKAYKNKFGASPTKNEAKI